MEGELSFPLSYQTVSLRELTKADKLSCWWFYVFFCCDSLGFFLFFQGVSVCGGWCGEVLARRKFDPLGLEWTKHCGQIVKSIYKIIVSLQTSADSQVVVICATYRCNDYYCYNYLQHLYKE